MQKQHAALPHLGSAWLELRYLYGCGLGSSARNYVFENEGCLLELELLEPYLPGSSFVYLPGYDDQE